jgi:hypothetical protein
MNPHIVITIIVAVALSSAGAFAEGRPGGKQGGKNARMPDRKEASEKVVPTIGKVSADSITVTGLKEEKTYKITKNTEIQFKGQKVPVDQLKEGMRVSVTMGSDATTAARISANEPPKDEPSEGGKGRGGEGDRGKQGGGERGKQDKK